mmetsp:Transcript_18998/g.37807  ORF Transcript_18998/g.37807 Transcript_18998/m.37807 type:complete len:420 (-) Transcript_18998:142-1401(-)
MKIAAFALLVTPITALCNDTLCDTLYEPVCGEDGITYSNDCDFGIARCNNATLLVLGQGACAPAALCVETFCFEVYEPVCGGDGITYSNDCFFGIAQCQNPGLLVAGQGECVSATEMPTTTTDFLPFGESGGFNTTDGCSDKCPLAAPEWDTACDAVALGGCSCVYEDIYCYDECNDWSNDGAGGKWATVCAEILPPMSTENSTEVMSTENPPEVLLDSPTGCECPEEQPTSWVDGTCDADAFAGCPACQYSDPYCYFNCMSGEAGGTWSQSCQDSFQESTDDRTASPANSTASALLSTGTPTETVPTTTPDDTVSVPKATIPATNVPAPNGTSCEELCPEEEPTTGSCNADAFAGCPACQYADGYCSFICVTDATGDMWARRCPGVAPLSDVSGAVSVIPVLQTWMVFIGATCWVVFA